MDIDQWVTDNKKRIAREFIRRIDLVTSTTPSGIITAGVPGAGKTEFTVELLNELAIRPLRLDMDEVAELIKGYRPEIADKFRLGATAILSRIYDETIKHKLDFVLDGTFAGSHAIENCERALRQGYQLKLYYIYQHPVIAWKFTQVRELVEHRAIDKNGFIETYYRLHDNVKILSERHKDVTISIILKNADNQIGLIKENVTDIDHAIPAIMSRNELEAAIMEAQND